MRKLKTILVASLVVASLYTATGTAWAQSESGQRGTAWTSDGGSTILGGPGGASWELSGFGFDF
ncbi:MAG TPA: hypothetical protein VIP07_11295 [Candidatus Limnocylindria bacterium]|jgi:hypothetical protein